MLDFMLQSRGAWAQCKSGLANKGRAENKSSQELELKRKLMKRITQGWVNKKRDLYLSEHTGQIELDAGRPTSSPVW
jgi:hypothetical protein